MWEREAKPRGLRAGELFRCGETRPGHEVSCCKLGLTEEVTAISHAIHKASTGVLKEKFVLN